MKNGPNTVKMGSITVKNAGAISASRLLLYSPVKRTLAHPQLPHGFGSGKPAHDTFKLRRLDGFSPFVDAVGLGNGDAFPLALEDVLPFQLRHRTEHGQHKLAGRRCGVDGFFFAD